MAQSAVNRMPVAFFGHGPPTITLDTNRYTDAWRTFAATLPVPRAILVVSAHWYVPRVRITAARKPETIHDFNEHFGKVLHAFDYPADGSPELIERVTELLAPAAVERDTTWGLDHGAYSVLSHTYPDANVPVVQLSVDRMKSPSYHYDVGRRLAPLRAEGVLIMGSGNVIHNLEIAEFRRERDPYAWAQRFDERFRSLLADGDHDRLVAYRSNGDDARLSVPTPDHYLPFLYVLAQQQSDESFETLVDGIEAGSVGMLSIALR